MHSPLCCAIAPPSLCSKRRVKKLLSCSSRKSRWFCGSASCWSRKSCVQISHGGVSRYSIPSTSTCMPLCDVSWYQFFFAKTNLPHPAETNGYVQKYTNTQIHKHQVMLMVMGTRNLCICVCVFVYLWFLNAPR